MIHINRSNSPIPGILVIEKRGGKRETSKAIKFYHDQLSQSLFSKEFDQLTAEDQEKVLNYNFIQNSNSISEGKNFKFGIYSSDEIKSALRELFHGKCAYCESRYASTQPMDVEHWRPKGGFVDENDTDKEKIKWPGYFWLAADWENLFPSCIDCNRRRNQEVFSQTKPLRMGKESQFPVVDESKRWRYPHQVNKEEPLLLNPCVDKPEEHLVFDKDAVVLPQMDPGNKTQPSRKAEESIRVYALNRTDLVMARQERLRLLEYHIHSIRWLSKLFEGMNENPTVDHWQLAIVEDLLAYEFATLRRFKDPDQPYSLLASQFIGAFEKEFSTAI